MKLLLALESENFPAQRRALRAPGLPVGERLGSPVVPPRALRDAAGGAVLVVDWERGEVLTRLDVPMPSGLAWPEPEGPLWAACQSTAQILALDPQSGQVLTRWSHPAFNDLHRLVPRPGGGLVVTASGTDSVIALDRAGAEVWSWWGNPARDRAHLHADDDIPTLDREIHPISLVAHGPDRALVSSFHHGTIFEVGRDLPPRTRFSGLRQPHGLVRTPTGWLVADTGRGRILRLDEDFQRAELVAESGRWLQDLAPTPEGGVWVVENKDFRGSEARSGGPRLLELDAAGRELARLELSSDWRLAALLPLDEPRAHRLGWPKIKVRARYRRAQTGGTAGG